MLNPLVMAAIHLVISGVFLVVLGACGVVGPPVAYTSLKHPPAAETPAPAPEKTEKPQ